MTDSLQQTKGLTAGMVAVMGICRLEAPVVGADIVECNPERDVGGMTAMVGAKLLKEVAALLAGRGLQDIR